MTKVINYKCLMLNDIVKISNLTLDRYDILYNITNQNSKQLVKYMILVSTL